MLRLIIAEGLGLEHDLKSGSFTYFAVPYRAGREILFTCIWCGKIERKFGPLQL